MTGNDLLINDSDLVTKRLDNIDSTKDIATLLRATFRTPATVRATDFAATTFQSVRALIQVYIHCKACGIVYGSPSGSGPSPRPSSSSFVERESSLSIPRVELRPMSTYL